ncbi:MAG: flavodoxin family protein [Proteobacteria bacterium]|nr:flavodoxin family protein [Pseudomonadota bacterium]MBU1057976.1 flavodoxin family protein [Pseudomonadota bacterium]
MHNLFILGSPRKNGNSETMAQAVAAGLLQSGGNSVEYVRLNKLHITPCQACGGCNTSGNCIIKDDMSELYDKTDQADRLFLVSPIYFYALTAQIKAYMDRCQARWSRKYLLGQEFRKDDQRTGYLLSCAATAGDKLFDGPILSVQCLFDTLELQYGEPLLIKSLEPRNAIQQLPDKLSDCERYGRRIATQ